MSFYSRQERHTKRVEFVVPAPPPWGAAWVEVMKAIRAATTELVVAGRVKAGEDPSDDTLWIRSWDDAVIVSYEDTRTTDAPEGGDTRG